MPTTLSSTFDLVFDGPALAAGGAGSVVTINMPAIGRGTFAVVGLNATANANGGVLTLTRSVTGGTVAVATVAAANTASDGVVTSANAVVPAGESLIATCSTQIINRFVITCQPVGTTVPQVIT